MERDWATVVGPSRQYSRFLLLLLALGIVLPAAGFALLARERRAEALQRARTEQEMRVARLIQHTLLPRDTPNLPGWQVSGHYQPAQAVGGDFYDYLRLDDGALGLVVGDVSGKGVPAALVMATTRSLVRSIGARVRSPGQVLAQVNDMLDRDIPSKMFVTCLYAVLDPVTGRLVYANAGHNLPYRTNPESGVDELRARGMPLGLMPGMVYEEVETSIEPGDCVLFYSDGLVEAHNTRREMFGGPRLRAILHGCANSCPTLITFVLEQLQAFTGTNWEQEDDVTLVTLQRSAVREALFPPSTSFVQDRALPELVPAAGPRASGPTQVVADAAVPCDGQPAGAPQADGHTPAPCDDPLHGTGWRLVARFSLPSAPGNEREVMRRVAQLVEPLIAAPEQLDRLKTAVAEATMNAMEHGNRYQPELPVEVCVLASDEAIAVRISDHGGGPDLERPPAPDLWAKLAGQQSPRGWGLFLMNHMVDDVHHLEDDVHHTVELILWLKGGMDGSQGA